LRGGVLSGCDIGGACNQVPNPTPAPGPNSIPGVPAGNTITLGCDFKTKSSLNLYVLRQYIPESWLAQAAAPFNANTFDASLAKLDLSGTTVPASATTGVYTITLYQGTTTVAANTFNWIKSGNYILASNPASVNAWVRQYPQATDFTAKANLKFSAPNNTVATVASASVYNAITYATSRTSISVGTSSGGGIHPAQ
jgi:hypothetical protein